MESPNAFHDHIVFHPSSISRRQSASFTSVHDTIPDPVAAQSQLHVPSNIIRCTNTAPMTLYRLPPVPDSQIVSNLRGSRKPGYHEEFEKPRSLQLPSDPEVSHASGSPVVPFDRSIFTRPFRKRIEDKFLPSIRRLSPHDPPHHSYYNLKKEPQTYNVEYTGQTRVHPLTESSYHRYPSPTLSSHNIPTPLRRGYVSCQEESMTSSRPRPNSTILLPPLQAIYPSSSTTGAKEVIAVNTTTTHTKKRKARICTAEGCQKYVVDHGLCIKHGGGKRCYIDSCNCRAQNRGLCWKHGGFTICKAENCTKRAKSRGICWTHGGGTRCKRDACTKIAVSLGLCWAHGGGKRCEVDGCRKPASERTANMCSDHYHAKITDQS